MLDYFLSEFKWYRKRRGGRWYKVRVVAHESGWTDGNIEYWTRTVKVGEEIIKTENYTK